MIEIHVGWQKKLETYRAAIPPNLLFAIQQPPAQVRGLIEVVFIYVPDSLRDFFFGETESLAITFGPNPALSAMVPKNACGQTLVSSNCIIDGFGMRACYEMNVVCTHCQCLNLMGDSFCFGEDCFVEDLLFFLI